MARPYLKFRFKEIEDLLNKKSNEDNIDDIIYELSLRKSPKAKALYAKIKNRKSNKNQSSQDNSNNNKSSNYENKSNSKKEEKTTLVEDNDIFELWCGKGT